MTDPRSMTLTYTPRFSQKLSFAVEETDKGVRVTRHYHNKSTASGSISTREFEVPFDMMIGDIEDWMDGKLIQDAMPHFTTQQRKWFMTGDVLTDFFANAQAMEEDK